MLRVKHADEECHDLAFRNSNLNPLHPYVTKCAGQYCKKHPVTQPATGPLCAIPKKIKAEIKCPKCNLWKEPHIKLRISRKKSL